MWAVALAALLPLPARGHSEPPPPPPEPPTPLPQVEVRDLKPLRWSWLHWWEANRPPYLRAVGQAAGEQEPEDGAGRERAVAALVAALEDPDAGVRAAAALALGHVGGPERVAALQARVEGDPDPVVAHRALLGLGLLGDAGAVPFLLEHEHPTAFLRATAVLTLGGLDGLDDRTLQRLDKLMGGDALTVNAAAETLIAPRPGRDGQRSAAWDADALRRTLGRASSPWVAVRVLHAMGNGDGRADGQAAPGAGPGRRGVGDARTDALLLDAAVAGPAFRESAAWEALEELGRRKEAQLQQIEGVQFDARKRQQAVDRWWELHANLVEQAPEPERPPGLFGFPPAAVTGRPGTREGVVRGLERIYRSRLQAAAVAALARRNPEGTEAALRTVLDRGDEDDAVPRAHAAVGLGLAGGPAGLARLLEIVEGTSGRDNKVGDHVGREDPLRGFAAIGLGLYARPVPGDQGNADRLGFERAVDTLLARLGDDRETDEVRAAAAVAVGLSGRTLALPALTRASGMLGPGDAPLPGYVLLARALLGEADLVEPVGRCSPRRPTATRRSTCSSAGRRCSPWA